MACTGKVIAFGIGILGAAGLTFALLSLQGTVRDLEAQVGVLAAEVTRFRIEQRAEGRGPQALLEKLQHYAPMLTSARTTQPDLVMAQSEMDAVLRAFQSLGSDAWQPILTRFQQLDGKANFDELKWLLRAAVRTDPTRGKELVAEVLQGTKKPNARLRWNAADLMIEIDRPRSQQLLRQVLLTESCRGLDSDRAAAYHLPMLDPAAVATSGFHNFVLHYLRSEDPQSEDTLLQVLVRNDHDAITLQEVIEALGKMKSAGAQQRIEELYRHPPGITENPLFLNKCLDALASIGGEAARPFLEAELGKAGNELVAKQIKHLLQQLGGPAPQGPVRREPKPEEPGKGK